jgi:peptide/nickel transport system substrate-binding protein
MKKLLVPLSILLVLAFILVGCSNQTSPAASTPATKAPASSSAAPPPSSSSPAPVTSKPPAPTTGAPPVATGSAPPATATTGAKAGGTLQFWIVSDPSSFWPPVMTGQTDGQNTSVCMETLFYFDQKANLVPLLATGWSSDPAAKTVTINLRKGVKFHDGSDFNAAVVKWNLEQYKAGARPELKNVSSIDVVDDSTIRINLSVFDNTIVTNLGNASDAGRMISQKAFEANGGKDWAAKNPVGTGPFQFVSYTKDVSVKWKRFDGYWGGKPLLDGIDMIRIADDTVKNMNFKAGKLDICGTITPSDAKAYQADPSKFKIVVPQYGQIPALAGYAKDPSSPFAKLEVRQAIAYAIDVKTFNDSFGLGFWTVMNQWAVPGTWGYSPNVKGYPYNPDKAKQLMAAAGYTTPLKTTLSFNNTGQSLIDENTALQAMLNKAGFDVTINPLQRPAFADAASNQKGWSGIIRQQGYANPDPLIKYAGVMAGQEFDGTYLNDELRNAYKAALSAPDTKTKQDLTWKFMELAVDKYCMAAHLDVQSSPTGKLTTVKDDFYGELPFGYLNPMTWLNK